MTSDVVSKPDKALGSASSSFRRVSDQPLIVENSRVEILFCVDTLDTTYLAYESRLRIVAMTSFYRPPNTAFENIESYITNAVDYNGKNKRNGDEPRSTNI